MDIGELEATVLAVVKTRGQTTAREVTGLLQRTRDIAYTTVNTTLDRLHRKRLLSRTEAKGRGGMHYVYAYVERATLREHIVTRAVERLLHAFGPSVVPTIYQKTRELSEAELSQLEGAVTEEKKRRG